MPKQLQIGSTIFNYPEAGDRAGWGEEATAWAEAVTEALSTVQGPNDILITSATLTNNQSSATDVPGLTFNTGDVQHIDVTFLIIRVFDSGSSTVTESGKIIGNFDGTTFSISTDSVGDAGVALTINNSGQIQYTTTDLSNHVSSTIKFRAQTIDQ